MARQGGHFSLPFVIIVLGAGRATRQPNPDGGNTGSELGQTRLRKITASCNFSKMRIVMGRLKKIRKEMCEISANYDFPKIMAEMEREKHGNQCVKNSCLVNKYVI